MARVVGNISSNTSCAPLAPPVPFCRTHFEHQAAEAGRGSRPTVVLETAAETGSRKALRTRSRVQQCKPSQCSSFVLVVATMPPQTPSAVRG